MIEKKQIFIGGQWLASAGTDVLYVTNPVTAAARERLIAAGFADVAMLLGQPSEAAAA